MLQVAAGLRTRTVPLTRAIGHFKTLCCLGLPKQAAMIAVARALHDVIPSEWNRIGLFDEHGNPGAGFAEHPGSVPLMLKHIDLFHGQDRDWTTFMARTFEGGGTGLIAGRYRDLYTKTGVFNLLDRPLDAYWLLDAMIHDGQRTIAGIVLTRPRNAKPFRADEIAQLDALRPWIAHALRDRGSSAQPCPAPKEVSLSTGYPVLRATLVLDRGERIVFRTPGAEFVLAVLEGMNDDLGPALRRVADTGLPSAVRQTTRRLIGAARPETAPPRLEVATQWGLVVVEAAWLCPPPHEGGTESYSDDPCIGVCVELREHAAVHAARILRASGATPTQVRVGILLAFGKHKTEIARELDVRPSSVQDAARKLYARMQVRNAAALSAMLWLNNAADG